MLGLTVACKLVATHIVKKKIEKAVDRHVPDSLKKASKIYSVAKKVKKVAKFA